MRAAVIDIGSSTIKLVIAEKGEDDIKVIESLKNLVDIGTETFYKGRISQEVVNQTISLLERYKEVIKQYEVSDTMVIATTAVREAVNKDIFIDTILRKTGFKIDVLNVGDVVYYIDSFLSHKLKKTYPIHERNLLIAELGAGSLDISVMEKGFTLMNLGAQAGTLRIKQFKNKIEGTLSETREALKEHIDNTFMSLKRSLPKIDIDDVILIDESYSHTLQNILPSKKREKGFFKFRLSESKRFLNKIAEGNMDEMALKYKIPTEIAESLDGYALTLNGLFRLMKNKSIYMLESSLSEALLTNILFGVEISKKYNKTNQLVSVATYLCRKYDLDVKHCKFVASLSEDLFNQLKDLLGLKPSDLLYLVLASYLHDIGTFINNRSHHKHSEYVINSQSLFRLTEEEIKIIACIARYHRKSTPLRTHFLYNSLTLDQQILVQKLSALLRIANALDSAHKQKVKKLEVAVNNGINLVITTQENFVLERTNFLEKKDLFEEISGNKVSLVIKKQV